MSLGLVLIGLLVLGVALITVGMSAVYRQRKRLHLGASKQALLLIGKEDPKPLTKQNGWRAQLHGYVVDLVYLPNSGGLFRLHLHRPLKNPPSFQLTCEPGINVIQYVVLSSQTTVTIDGELYKGTIDEISRGVFPGLSDHIKKLEAFSTEPLKTIQIKDGWVTATRDILQSSLSQRKLTTTKEIETHLIKLINQTAKALDVIDFKSRDDAQLLRDMFYGATAFESLRHKTLRDLMQKHGHTAEAEEVWAHTLGEGNLYDALFLLNHNQQRFLRDISPARLLALVNGIQKSKRFETSALPQLLAQRFDFDVVLNPSLDWDVCQALVMLGMRDPANDHTRKILRTLFDQSQPERQTQILELSTQAHYGPMIDIITSSGMATPLPHWQAMIECLGEIAQHTEDGFDQANTESYLLDVIDQDIQDLTCDAIIALGHVGLVPAMTRLRQLQEGNTWKIGKLSRETKRAMELIEHRLRQMPNRGGITLTQDDQTSGALSVSTVDGGLEVVNHEQ